MTIDVVIVNYRSAADTLGSVAQLGSWQHGTVWVIDNSEDPSEADHLKRALQQHDWVRFLVPPRNLGFGQACNLAFAQSVSPYFLLLNPDARIATDQIDRLRQTLEAMPDCAAIAPNMRWNAAGSFLIPLGSPQSPWETVRDRLLTHSFGTASALARWAVQDNRRRLDEQSPPAEVAMVSGAVLLLRRSAVLSAGGLFDPDYFMFFEDADLSRRLRQTGWKLTVLPSAMATHEYRHGAHKAALMQASQRVFLLKHHARTVRWSRDMAWVERLGRPGWPAQWFDLDEPVIDSAAAFQARYPGWQVAAFSPSWLMRPAIFRPAGRDLAPLDDAEWAQLEPGHYTALLSADAKRLANARWVHFCKAAPSDRPASERPH